MSLDISCIIIDDEPKAVELLRQRLEVLYPNIKIQNSFTEWKKGLEFLRTSTVDLVFLDISMPEKTGIDFLKLFPTIPFQVIFITAHTDFALQAIKFSAAGYVLKPIDDYELSFAVNKALERLNNTPRSNSNNNSAASNPLKIGIPNVKGVDYLNAEDILYFESVNKYTKVVTKEYSMVSSYNLGEFKKIADLPYFYQVHRSYIVNLYHIKRYETSGTLVMQDNMEIPVSRLSRADFQSKFSQITRIAGLKSKDTDI
jgi:two-component system LytT family response regulator